jgi:glycosyltransferase involved in cell wall biosynthesis
LIATCGDEAWSELAWKRAYPSTISQGFDEVILEHHPDATLAEARNRILASADCDFVVFLDADDELEHGYLDAMKRAHDAAGGEPVLLAPAIRYVHAGRRPENPRFVNRGRWPRLNECVIGTGASRRLLLEIGGFDEWEAWDDWALWLKCVAKGARIVYVEDAIYRAHVSPNSRHRSVRNGSELHARISAAHREWAAREGVASLL